jgi:hypothetical protein
LKKKNGKKGFASTIFASLALLIIALSAAAVLSMQQSESNAKRLFEAKQAHWLFQDAKNVLENALYDAEVDSAYASYGCGTATQQTCESIEKNGSVYLQNALAYVSASTQFAFAANNSGFTITCGSVQATQGGGEPEPQPPEGGGGSGGGTQTAVIVEYENLSINARFLLKVNSSDSIQLESVEYKHQVNVTRTTTTTQNNVQSKSFRILVSKPGTQEVIADLRGTCSGIFVTSTSTEQPTPMPAVVEITATPTHAPPSGSPYAFVPTPTPPTAGEKPTAPPAPTPPSVKPTAAATRTPPVVEKAAAPDYTFLALGLAFLALVAAYYFKKKSRPEPKSLSYVARQRKRL